MSRLRAASLFFPSRKMPETRKWPRNLNLTQGKNILQWVDYEQSLFFPSSKMPETRKWPRVTEGVRQESHDKRETTRKPERMVFHGLVMWCFGVKTEVLTGQARETWPKSLLEQQRFSYFFFWSTAYAVHRVRVYSKLIDWANLNFGR